jgi:beta-lactamase superfamily II metal-dependent hydrolase
MTETPIFYILDIGQGSCNVIDLGPSDSKSSNNNALVGRRAIVIDCGPATPEILPELLALRGIEVIEALVLTHADQDHVNGLKHLIGAMSGRIKYVHYTFDRVDGKDMVDVLEEHFKKGRILNQPEPIMVGQSPKLLYPQPIELVAPAEDQVQNQKSYPLSNVKLWALAPDAHQALLAAKKKGKANHVSAVCLAEVDGPNVLFPGDSTIENWQTLHNKRKNSALSVGATVISHHGGKVHAKPEELKWLYTHGLKTEYGIISAGTDNAHGHPRQDVLNELYVQGVRVVCTQVTPNCSNCDQVKLQNHLGRKGIASLPSFSNVSKDDKIPCSGTIEFCMRDNRVTFASPASQSCEDSWLGKQMTSCPLLFRS